MENKTKILILILVAILIGVALYFGLRIQQETASQQNTPVVAEPVKPTVKEEKPAIPVMVVPAEVTGAIEKVDPTFLIVTKADGIAVQFPITKETKFLKTEGEVKKEVTLTDIKENMNVSLRINDQTGEILEVTVLE